ncbi:MAG: hypothetical protein NZ739_04700 [Verrucomicrobiae bacterium]|nr:hypothetical protein [Verrucomicrobiae bacterium]MDW7980678.1 hypothetical protein [Verrucomicrobiales bacterium]
MKPKIVTVLSAACGLVCGVLVVANAEPGTARPDPSGTWKWNFTTRSGETREVTLKLKLDGDKLTGTISGRLGETEISDATLKGDEISFLVVREFGETRFTNKYSGKITGDTIKGKLEFVDRQGQQQTRAWEAKREPAQLKESSDSQPDPGKSPKN